MKIKMYSFYDTAAQAYTQPFFMHNDGLAMRAFQDNVNSTEENNMSLHPEQFKLFQIAEWDDQKATITAPETGSKLVAVGHELINSPKPDESTLKQILEALTNIHKEQSA